MDTTGTHTLDNDAPETMRDEDNWAFSRLSIVSDIEVIISYSHKPLSISSSWLNSPPVVQHDHGDAADSTGNHCGSLHHIHTK